VNVPDYGQGPRREDGTSISTFIGAGVAGLVIDFVRRNRERIRYHDLIQSLDGMRAVFVGMGRDAKQGKYYCLEPRKVLDNDDITDDNKGGKCTSACIEITHHLRHCHKR
jgi:hypothetical protein